jgi:hypothetical protein
MILQSAQHLYEKREGSGSVPLTNGSGFWWPKNMRIRILNTAFSAMKAQVLMCLFTVELCFL